MDGTALNGNCDLCSNLGNMQSPKWATLFLEEMMRVTQDRMKLLQVQDEKGIVCTTEPRMCEACVCVCVPRRFVFARTFS